MRRISEHISAWLLRLAETFYLRAHGWKHVRRDPHGRGEWRAPVGWPSTRALRGRLYGHTHAVNSTKFYGREPGLWASVSTRDDDDDLEAKLRASLKRKRGE